MRGMSSSNSYTPTAPLVAAGLIGGYGLARATGVRAVGGAALAAAGVAAGRQWVKLGIPETVALSVTYLGAFGLSHPLAKKLGAWPSVLAVTAAASAATYLVADRGA